MTKSTEKQPVAVSERTIRTGKAWDPRFWVEPTVWTERMLVALEQGVKGGKWFSLIDKVHPERTLRAAFSQVAANEGAAGVDHVTIAMFAQHLDEELKRLSEQLRTGTYRPQAIRRHYIPKPGTQEKRPLGIPICLSYCTSFQWRWGLTEQEPAQIGPYFSEEADFLDQVRRVGLRKRETISGVSLIHQGA